MTRVILFDWDGTLVDNFSVIHNGLNAVFKSFNMKLWSDDESRKNIRLTAADLFSQLFPNKSDMDYALDIYRGYVEKHHIEYLVELKGAAKMLSELKQRGYILGIVSNKTQRFLDKEVRELAWDNYFDVIIGAGTAPKDKPNPDSIFYALSKLELDNNKDEVFYVGDTETDMFAAQAANIDSVFVSYGLGETEHILDNKDLIKTPIISNNFIDLLYTLTQ